MTSDMIINRPNFLTKTAPDFCLASNSYALSPPSHIWMSSSGSLTPFSHPKLHHHAPSQPSSLHRSGPSTGHGPTDFSLFSNTSKTALIWPCSIKTRPSRTVSHLIKIWFSIQYIFQCKRQPLNIDVCLISLLAGNPRFPASIWFHIADKVRDLCYLYM